MANNTWKAARSHKLSKLTDYYQIWHNK